MKKFKTFDDIIKASGEDFLTEGLEDHEIAYRKLVLIAKVLNGNWKPDWENYNEYKYMPYFWKQNGAFVCSHYDCWSSNASVGSRLCFKSSDLAEYAGKTFIDIYRKFLE